MGESPKIGSDTARVKMIVFIDYQCPYCEKFVKEQLPLLKNRYIRRNLLQINFRNYPLPSHKNANTLAHSASLLYEKGKFEDFLSEVWNLNSIADTAEIYNELGVPKVSQAKKIQIQKEIDESKFYAGIAGISATPTFIINDRVIVGVNSMNDMMKLIAYSINNSVALKSNNGTCK